MTVEQRLEKYLRQTPEIHPSVYLAEGAIVIGAVKLKEAASIWHHCVLRADINCIEVGKASNIQDGTIIHLADDFGVKIGDYVTVGHRAMIHACEIEDECLIGMGATIMDGTKIGKRSIIGAGALVTKNQQIPPGSLVMGSPAKVVRTLPEEQQINIKHWAEKYVKVAAFHKKNLKR